MTDQDRIADRRDLGAFIPATLDDYPLTPLEFRLYCRAVRRAGGGGTMRESMRRLAARWGASDATLREARKFLVAAGLLEELGRAANGQHKMALTPESQWADPTAVADIRAGVLRPDERPGRRQTRGRSDRTPEPGTAVAATAGCGSGDRTTAVAATDEGTPERFSKKVLHPQTPSSPGEEEVGCAILEQLRRHLDAGATGRLDRDPALGDLVVTLDRLAGWPPADAASALTADPLGDARSIARVLTARARHLTRIDPPAPDRRRPADDCPTCHGSGWAPTGTNTVAPCACQEAA